MSLARYMALPIVSNYIVMSATPLGPEQIRTALVELHGWQLQNDKLVKMFSFASFREAVAFIVRLAFHAEEINHHPEIHNSYNRVEIMICTHEAGDKVTELDVRLARSIEAFSWV